MKKKASTLELIDAGLINMDAYIDGFGPGSMDARLADMSAPGGFERWVARGEAKSNGKKFEPMSEMDRLRTLVGVKTKGDDQ